MTEDSKLKQIGLNIKAEQVRAGLTQEQLAEKLTGQTDPLLYNSSF